MRITVFGATEPKPESDVGAAAELGPDVLVQSDWVVQPDWVEYDAVDQ